jgi:hypothetical protein
MLILYVDGMPRAKFNGAKNVQSLQGHITNALSGKNARAQPSYQPQQPGENMYGPSQHTGNAYIPEQLGPEPSLKGAIRAQPPRGFQNSFAGVEEDGEPRLLVPGEVTPYNTPWETEIKSSF